MISMTGFGRAVAEAPGGRRVVVELRSVNHRSLDVKVRSRSLSGAAEVEVIRAIRAACARGSIQVAIDEEAEPELRNPELSEERLGALARRLEGLRRALGLAGAIDLATLAAFARLERERAAGPVPLGWEDVGPALGEALAALAATRAQEGAALATELRTRAATLRRLGDEIRTRVPASAERATRRLSERVALALAAFSQAGTPIDPSRLAQEAAILADRLDVSEELARLFTHLGRLDELLGDGAPVNQGQGIGRPLEFLLQEIGRELNTLGNKAQDADISALVIAGKAELEKIREQAQNIE